MSEPVDIARCPEHGLHGQREECFVCGGPVEQVPMVPASELERAEVAARELAQALRELLGWSRVATFDEVPGEADAHDAAREVLARHPWTEGE